LSLWLDELDLWIEEFENSALDLAAASHDRIGIELIEELAEPAISAESKRTGSS
jgi:hypothetical protein